jgi:hypothetical protein
VRHVTRYPVRPGCFWLFLTDRLGFSPPSLTASVLNSTVYTRCGIIALRKHGTSGCVLARGRAANSSIAVIVESDEDLERLKRSYNVFEK